MKLCKSLKGDRRIGPTFRAESEAMKPFAVRRYEVAVGPTFRAESEAMKPSRLAAQPPCRVRRLEPNQRR